MFGYIVLSSSAPKEDRKTYREAYCGLCHTLKNKYGKAGMLSLSYDMTFLSLLLSDIEDSPKIEGKERCLVHPIVEVARHDDAVTELQDLAPAAL